VVRNHPSTYARRAPAVGSRDPGSIPGSSTSAMPAFGTAWSGPHAAPLDPCDEVAAGAATKGRPTGTGDRSDATKGVGGRVLSTPSSHEPVAHRRLAPTAPVDLASAGAFASGPVPAKPSGARTHVPGSVTRHRPAATVLRPGGRVDGRQERRCTCRSTQEHEGRRRPPARPAGHPRGAPCTDREMWSPPVRPPRVARRRTGGRSGATKGVGERVLSTTSSHDRGVATPRTRRPPPSPSAGAFDGPFGPPVVGDLRA
jgi:hypothetical protein